MVWLEHPLAAAHSRPLEPGEQGRNGRRGNRWTLAVVQGLLCIVLGSLAGLVSSYPPRVEVVLGGGLWPLGRTVGFVELDLAGAIEAYRVWTRGWRPLRPSFKHVRETLLIDQLRRLLPLEMPYTRRLLIAHGQRWTAIFDNSRGGGDPYPAVAELSRIAGTRGVVAGHTPQEQYPYPATQFHLFGDNGDYVRTIDCGVFDSGRWSFEEERSSPTRNWRRTARGGSAIGSRDQCCFATCPRWR